MNCTLWWMTSWWNSAMFQLAFYFNLLKRACSSKNKAQCFWSRWSFCCVHISHPVVLLCSFLCTNEGIANESKKLYGAQFHPEVSLTVNGKMILKNFLYDIAGCSGTFTVENRELQCIQNIKEKVGSSKVLVSIWSWSWKICLQKSEKNTHAVGVGR